MLSALTARRTFLATAAAGLCAVTTAASRTKGPIRIGQIGVGHAHASKLSVYRNNPDYEVVGIVEPDEQLRNAAQTRDPYRDLNWMTREQLLNTPGLQAVLVETQVRDLLEKHRALEVSREVIGGFLNDSEQALSLLKSGPQVEALSALNRFLARQTDLLAGP